MFRSGCDVVSLLLRKRPAGFFLRLVDQQTRFGHPDQSGQTKRALRHVLHQTLDPSLVAGRQKHRLIDAETAVSPTAQVLDDFWFGLLIGQIQLEDCFLLGGQHSLYIELWQLQKIDLRCKRVRTGHRCLFLRYL